MKRLAHVAGVALAFVAFAALLAAVSLNAPLLQPKVRSDSRAFVSPISPLPIPTSAVASPVPTTRTEPGAPTPTPLPDRGVRVGPLTEIPLVIASMGVEEISELIVENSTSVARARTSTGVTIVSVNLNNGRVEPLAPISQRGVESPRISNGSIAWIEDAPQLGSNQRRAQVLMPGQVDPFTPVSGLVYQLDLKQGILVWQEYRGQAWGIYGHNLHTGHAFTVTAAPRLSAHPRVCSQNWIVYTQTSQDTQTRSADLRAYNTITGVDSKVGEVYLPQDGSAGRQHACDGHRAAWISVAYTQVSGVERDKSGQERTVTNTLPQYSEHVYDLETGNDRVIDQPVSGSTSLQLSGDVLIGGVGFDLRRNVPFDLRLSPPQNARAGRSITVANDRLIILFSGEPGQPQRLYTAPILRDPQ